MKFKFGLLKRDTYFEKGIRPFSSPNYWFIQPKPLFQALTKCVLYLFLNGKTRFLIFNKNYT